MQSFCKLSKKGSLRLFFYSVHNTVSNKIAVRHGIVYHTNEKNASRFAKKQSFFCKTEKQLCFLRFFGSLLPVESRFSFSRKWILHFIQLSLR